MATVTERRDLVDKTFASKVEAHHEGLWVERTTQDGTLREVVLRRPVPMRLLERYARLAVRRAVLEQRDDGRWFAKIPDFEGVWAEEASVPEALEVLHEVVVEWTLLKVQDQDGDLPVIEDINLNTL